MCQIPTGRPLTSSYVWHFFFLITSVTNEAFTAERQSRELAIAASSPNNRSVFRHGTRTRVQYPSVLPEAGLCALCSCFQAAKANLEKALSALAGASDEAARAEVQISIEANEAIVKALE